MSKKFRTLVKKVLENSEANTWEEARLEWKVVGLYVNEDDDEHDHEEIDCTCTHPDIKYCFTIYNEMNRRYLYPIGSRCIDHFESDTMTDEAREWRKDFKLIQ
jgi:hypothetical protein